MLDKKFWRKADKAARQRQQNATAVLSPSQENPFATAGEWHRKLTTPLGTFLTGVRNKCAFVQLSGHQGNFFPGHGGTIFKKGSLRERDALDGLMSDSAMKNMVPLYYGSLPADDPDMRYLEMQDLLGGFDNPSVMDVKMVGVSLTRCDIIMADRAWTHSFSSFIILKGFTHVSRGRGHKEKT